MADGVEINITSMFRPAVVETEDMHVCTPRDNYLNLHIIVLGRRTRQHVDPISDMAVSGVNSNPSQPYMWLSINRFQRSIDLFLETEITTIHTGRGAYTQPKKKSPAGRVPTF